MRLFRLYCDRLFVLSIAAYAVNRFLIRPHVASSFLHNQFDDTLLVPCALPPLLLTYRTLGLRNHDGPPTSVEISLHLVLWSALFEAIGPFVLHQGISDVWDVVAYCAGAIIAWLYWRRATVPSGCASALSSIAQIARAFPISLVNPHSSECGYSSETH